VQPQPNELLHGECQHSPLIASVLAPKRPLMQIERQQLVLIQQTSVDDRDAFHLLCSLIPVDGHGA
jgi:hypothetical protein